MESKPTDKEKKLDILNHWPTLVANVGVLVGIIFLVLEFWKNTTAMGLFRGRGDGHIYW